MVNTKIIHKTKTLQQTDLGWKVILFDCNCHTLPHIIDELIGALGCSMSTASKLADVAEKLGSVVIFIGDKVECERIANKLERTWITVEVKQ